MIKNFVLLQHVVSANRGLVFTGAPGLFHSKKRFCTATMNSTNLDPTRGIETPMEPPPVLKPVQVSRLREVTGTLPMETAWEQLWKEGIIPWDA